MANVNIFYKIQAPSSLSETEKIPELARDFRTLLPRW
jgi:hypothetical protein